MPCICTVVQGMQGECFLYGLYCGRQALAHAAQRRIEPTPDLHNFIKFLTKHRAGIKKSLSLKAAKPKQAKKKIALRGVFYPFTQHVHTQLF